MELTETELFEGDKGDSVRIEQGEEVEMTVSYSLDEDRRKTPYMDNYVPITLSRSERSGAYIATSESRELRACSYNPLRAIAEIISHVRETYNYTEHYYKSYSREGDVDQLRVYQNDSILFRVGELKESEEKYEITDHTFSYDFWETLHRTEHESSRTIESIDYGMIGVQSLRIPVKKQMDSIEKELIVQLNKYLIEFYKDDNVLGKDMPLHKFIGFAALCSGHPVDISQLTLHYEKD